jgi:SPP1 Gp6-like portal protein
MRYYPTDEKLQKKALALFQDGRRYHEYQLYYAGHHPIAYASEKWRSVFGRLFSRFADNLCPAVVSAIADRLKVTGFSIQGLKKDDQPTAEQQTIIDKLMMVWEENRMDFNSIQIMSDALRDGDGYVIVWPDQEDPNQIHIYPQDAQNVRVCYDKERPGKVKWAVKAYKDDDGKIRLTLYFADRVEKYITRNKRDDIPQKWDAFVRFDAAAGNDEDEVWPVVNPWGVVPVFHFANDAKAGRYGVSELEIVIPMQNGLNKSVLDLLAGMEYIAFPQRYATGMSLDTDETTGEKKPPFKPGVDRLWVSPGQNVKFGQFEQGEMTQFIAVNDSFRMEVCRLTGIPLHYFQMSGDAPSGEALKALEARLVKKVERRQGSFGNTWEDVMRFVHIIQTNSVAEANKTRLNSEWADPQPTSDKEKAETAGLKSLVGVPQEQLWKEMGYTEAQIAEFRQLKDEAEAKAMENAAALANRGGDVPPTGADE